MTQASDYHHLYGTSAWQTLSLEIKVRDLWTCQKCGHICTKKREAVTDHKTPHKGNLSLFWDPDNLWCLCQTCHDVVKRKEENPKRMQRTDGW